MEKKRNNLQFNSEFKRTLLYIIYKQPAKMKVNRNPHKNKLHV